MVTSADLIECLALPTDAFIERRVPKKLLLEQNLNTKGDKRRIQEGIQELLWVAVLKPTTIGVPIFEDEVRQYLEIAVLTLMLSDGAKSARITELVHGAIPYPVVLITSQDETVSISLAHKRNARNETRKTVVEDLYRTSLAGMEMRHPVDATFLKSISIAMLASKNLFDLYQGLIDRLVALEVARITGNYCLPNTFREFEVLCESLKSYTQLTNDIAALRTQAATEKQINRRVELNQKIKKSNFEQLEILKKLKFKDGESR